MRRCPARCRPRRPTPPRRPQSSSTGVAGRLTETRSDALPPQQRPDIGGGSGGGPRIGVGGAHQAPQRAFLLTGEFGQFRCLTADFAATPGYQGQHLDRAVVHLAGQPFPLLQRRGQPRGPLQFGVGATGGLRGHADRQPHRQLDDDGGVAAQVDVDVSLERSGWRPSPPARSASRRSAPTESPPRWSRWSPTAWSARTGCPTPTDRRRSPRWTASAPPRPRSRPAPRQVDGRSPAGRRSRMPRSTRSAPRTAASRWPAGPGRG